MDSLARHMESEVPRTKAAEFCKGSSCAVAPGMMKPAENPKLPNTSLWNWAFSSSFEAFRSISERFEVFRAPATTLGALFCRVCNTWVSLAVHPTGSVPGSVPGSKDPFQGNDAHRRHWQLGHLQRHRRWRSWKKCRKPAAGKKWGRKIWEMYGKCMGNVWEMYGKCMGNVLTRKTRARFGSANWLHENTALQ